MIERILPLAVATADTRAHTVDTRLYPAEEAVIRRAGARRRNEFRTVRACARAALAGLGHPPAAILPGERGAPRWPPGVVGSMTHCRGYRAAAVAAADDVRALGIDAEPHLPLPGGVLDEVALEGERTRIAELVRLRPDIRWDRLLFSAKESVYKAWFPLTRRRLGFTDVDIFFSVDRGAFHARLLVESPIPVFHGSRLVQDGIILTSIVLHSGQIPDAAMRLTDESATV